MRLAKSDATINKERVIFLARPLGYRQRGGVRELIARPDDKFCEREAGVQLRMDSHQLAVTCPGARWDGSLCNGSGWMIVTVPPLIAVREFVTNATLANNQPDPDRFPGFGR